MLPLFISQSPHADKANCALRLVVTDVKLGPHIFSCSRQPVLTRADLAVELASKHYCMHTMGGLLHRREQCLPFDEALRVTH
jgi:hypothetical protein